MKDQDWPHKKMALLFIASNNSAKQLGRGGDVVNIQDFNNSAAKERSL